MGTESSIFISEAARIIGVSQQTLRAWDKNGRLVPDRVGGFRVYDRAAVLACASNRAIDKHGWPLPADVVADLERHGWLSPEAR